jgi:hypothetical protein
LRKCCSYATISSVVVTHGLLLGSMVGTVSLPEVSH